MENRVLSRSEAKRFILYKQGLIGNYRFRGKEGILQYVRQAGCIQFDPIDVCGKNAELVLQSRVEGFRKPMLYELLYTDRSLVDYFDKNLAVMQVSDWKYFDRERQMHRMWEWSRDEIRRVCGEVKAMIARSGPLCSADLDMPAKVRWYWSDTKLSRAALEHLYFSGELGIHHKKGTIKYYDLIENCIPLEILHASEPYPDDFEHLKWRVARRIGAIGLLWNRASDAFLNIHHLKSKERSEIFASLLKEKKIQEVRVQDIKEPLYLLSEDEELLLKALNDQQPPCGRCEFIAPLDNMMWDRNLIRALFDFDYKWEIYTPVAERKYGYYVLPILLGDRLLGRIEAVCDRRNRELNVKNIWYENGSPSGTEKQLIENAIDRFTAFHFA